MNGTIVDEMKVAIREASVAVGGQQVHLNLIVKLTVEAVKEMRLVSVITQGAIAIGGIGVIVTIDTPGLDMITEGVDIETVAIDAAQMTGVIVATTAGPQKDHQPRKLRKSRNLLLQSLSLKAK